MVFRFYNYQNKQKKVKNLGTSSQKNKMKINTTNKQSIHYLMLIFCDQFKITSTTMDNSIIHYYYQKIKQSHCILKVIMNYFMTNPCQWHKYSFSKHKTNDEKKY